MTTCCSYCTSTKHINTTVVWLVDPGIHNHLFWLHLQWLIYYLFSVTYFRNVRRLVSVSLLLGDFPLHVLFWYVWGILSMFVSLLTFWIFYPQLFLCWRFGYFTHVCFFADVLGILSSCRVHGAFCGNACAAIFAALIFCFRPLFLPFALNTIHTILT